MQSKPVFARRLTTALGGAFAAAMILASCGGSNDTPEGAVENFLDNGVEDFANAISDNDFDEAVSIAEDYLCADDVDALKETAEEIGNFTDEELAEMDELTGDEDAVPEDWSYEVGDSTEDGDEASVEVEMTEDDETETQSIDLVKEDDEWRICGFN